jgi:hypothetical protein
MELTTRDGVPWVAYIEGIPATRRHRLLRQTVLPGRRLRFDSPTESRVSPELPAGSPFLSEQRLRRLLALSPLVPAVEVAAASRSIPWHRRWHVPLASGLRFRARAGRVFAEAARAAHLAAETILYGHRARS